MESIGSIDSNAVVIGSGPSLDDFNTDFLDNLRGMGTVIGVNNTAFDFPCDFNVRKSFGKEASLPNSMPNYDYKYSNCKLIISEYDCGDLNRNLRNTSIPGDYYFFTHQHNEIHWLFKSRINWPEEGEIVVSWSTMTSALHVAAELGAKNIFVIGHDLRGGNYSGYPLARGPKYSRFRKQSVAIKKFLQERYNCNIITLSPYSGIGYHKD